MHTSLHITTAEDHKRAHIKLDGGVGLALEARRRAEEEEERTGLEAEKETHLIKEERYITYRRSVM